MFGILNNLAKAAVSAVVTPVAIVADVARLPVTSTEHRSDPFEYTSKSLEGLIKNLEKAIDSNA